MIKYAKITNPETGLCEVGLGINSAFYKSIGMTLLDIQQSDVDGAWYLAEKCPMLTDKEKAEKEKQARIEAIKQELENIDKQKIRAMTEPEIKDPETGETWLEFYNNQAKVLRKELEVLEDDTDDNQLQPI